MLNLVKWVFAVFATSTFIPSDNIPHKAYKTCGSRPTISTIDEPVPRSKRSNQFSPRPKISFHSNDEFLFGRTEREASDTRILNGRELSMDGEWPWLSMIVRQGTENDEDARIQCVGVVVNCNTVLTTASCAKTATKGDQVRIGTPVLKESVMRRKIEKIISHPSFTTTRKTGNLKIHHNNIALIFLDEPITQDILYEQGKVAPVCQTDDSSFLNSNCWALGVTTSSDMSSAPFMSSAVQLDVEKQSLKYCNRYGYAEQLKKNQHTCIKAKWDSENQGFCQLADNGAPVICKRENSQNEFFLLGLFSSSEKCETFPKPAVFQETASFTDWIESTIQKEKKCICHRIIPGRQLISPDKCCLNSPYNSGMKQCCGGKLLDLEGPLQCCYGVPYDQQSHTCSTADGLIHKTHFS